MSKEEALEALESVSLDLLYVAATDPSAFWGNDGNEDDLYKAYKIIKQSIKQGHLRTTPEPIEGLDEALDRHMSHLSNSVHANKKPYSTIDAQKIHKAAKAYSKLVKGE